MSMSMQDNQLFKQMSRQTNIYLYRILICILLLSLNQLSGAQNAPTVNSILEGTVVDENTNQPLEGANIAIEGVTNQTTTNARGQFELRTGQKFPYNIIITFIGYEKKIVLANGSPVHVKLAPAKSQLDDVVVVGYGTQRRSDVVGSIARIKAGEVNKIPVASFDAQIQGKAAGLQVITNSGVPGESIFCV